MVISKASPADINGTAHFMIEIEDDPFKCGKHAVEVFQSIRTGELTEFKFHKEETELSSRCAALPYCSLVALRIVKADW